jgi:hypothetical protein
MAGHRHLRDQRVPGGIETPPPEHLWRHTLDHSEMMVPGLTAAHFPDLRT